MINYASYWQERNKKQSISQSNSQKILNQPKISVKKLNTKADSPSDCSTT